MLSFSFEQVCRSTQLDSAVHKQADNSLRNSIDQTSPCVTCGSNLSYQAIPQSPIPISPWELMPVQEGGGVLTGSRLWVERLINAQS